MANEKIIDTKKAEVKALAEKMKEAKLVLFTDYRGINVTDVTDLRTKVRNANGEYKVVEARIVTNSDMHAHNTFEVSDKVVEKDFTGYEIKNSNIVVKLPANSVVELRLQK